jgi:UDPglucose 6-dehydrogenase
VKLGIIGMGHVGEITKEIMSKWHSVVTFDTRDNQPYPYDELANCDFVIICVDTPTSSDGSADLGSVHSAFSDLPERIPAIVRSTVPPGTCDSLARRYRRDVIHWPEYIGETSFIVSTWSVLASQDPFLILGTASTETSGRWVDALAEIFGPLVVIHEVSRVDAELTKYMENAFFALKVAFVNEFRRIVESYSGNWQRVRQGWLLDPRVSRDHSDAFSSNPGFSGKCLPKDLAAITAAARARDLLIPLLESIDHSNRVTQRHRDAHKLLP